MPIGPVVGALLNNTGEQDVVSAYRFNHLLRGRCRIIVCVCVFSVYIAAMIAADRYEEMVGTVIKKNRRRTIGRGGFLRGIRVCCGKRWVFDCVADSSSIGGEECEDPRFVGKSYAFRRLSNVSSAVAKSLIARKPCSASSNYSNYSNYFDPKQYARTDNYSSLESSSPCASHSSRLSINRINRSPIHESRKYESKVLLEAHLPRNTATIRV